MSKIIYLIKRVFNEALKFSHNLRALIYSKLYKKPLIQIIGDSHVMSFRKDVHFSIHDIGPATAFNLKNEKSTTKSNKKLFKIIKKINRKNDIVMLSFGEIDCRNHIYNEYKKNEENIPISELINRTISNYGEVLQKLREKGVNFCVLSIPPVGKQENIYNFPYYATPELRSLINREFNKKLEAFCKESGSKFINIYPKVSDKNGFILENFAADKIHLNDKIVKFAIEELDKLFEVM